MFARRRTTSSSIGAASSRFHHPLIGDLTLSYDALEIPADPGQTMLVYTAEPGSPSQEALDFLASWTQAPRHGSAVPADEEA